MLPRQRGRELGNHGWRNGDRRRTQDGGGSIHTRWQQRKSAEWNRHSSLNGTIYDETFSGTYTVSSNCTGTLTGYIYISGALAYTVTINLAFDQNMEHMPGLFTSAVEPDGTSLQTVIALDAHKQ